MMDFSKEYEFAWLSVLFLITCLILYVLARLVFSFVNRKVDVRNELIHKDNPAFYAAYVSYFIGFVMIIGGVMNSGGTQDLKLELMYTVLYGSIGFLARDAPVWLMELNIHRLVPLWKQIEKGDMVSGIVKVAI